MRTTALFNLCWLALVAVCPPGAAAPAGQAERPASRGPLRVHPTNPRYFTDDGQRAVYLTGSHTWCNFQDMGTNDPPAAFDFDAYLRFLEKYGHNFIRLWHWELMCWDSNAKQGRLRQYATPHPWLRTGPGNAVDGQPKFNLERFNPAYFERLRARVKAAGEHGVYVSVMLFEGWGLQHVPDALQGHPCHRANNINGFDSDPFAEGRSTDTHTLWVRSATVLQERYVRHVVDTVNDLDNVLYEIANESGAYSTEWQHHFIRFIKDYERTKPKQHPVGMTFQYSSDPKQRGTNQGLFDSPADWISPNSDAGPFNYRTNPPPATGAKVVLSDTDHLWGEGGDYVWVWKTFLRGLQPIYMDRIVELRGDKRGDIAGADAARRAMGQTRRLADRANLAKLRPQSGLASSEYCLAQPGATYLVYQPVAGPVTVDLTGARGSFIVEWLHPVTGETKRDAEVQGGARREFAAPFAGDAVLHLRKP
jgi:hypothetical protein